MSSESVNAGAGAYYGSWSGIVYDDENDVWLNLNGSVALILNADYTLVGVMTFKAYGRNYSAPFGYDGSWSPTVSGEQVYFDAYGGVIGEGQFSGNGIGGPLYQYMSPVGGWFASKL